MQMNKATVLGPILCAALVVAFWAGRKSSDHAVQIGENESRQAVNALVLNSASRPASGNPAQTQEKPAIQPENPALPQERVAHDWSQDRQGKFTRQNVLNTFGKAIAGLKLTPEDERKLVDLLVERGGVVNVVRGVLDELGLGITGYMGKLVANARADIEGEMADYFGPERFAKIQAMLAVDPYLRQIGQNYDPILTEAGVPITPEQIVPLAEILFKTYGSRNNPVSQPTPATIDAATGLTQFDREAINKAGAILSDRQVTALRKAMAERNNGILTRSLLTESLLTRNLN